MTPEEVARSLIEAAQRKGIIPLDEKTVTKFAWQQAERFYPMRNGPRGSAFPRQREYVWAMLNAFRAEEARLRTDPGPEVEV